MVLNSRHCVHNLAKIPLHVGISFETPALRKQTLDIVKRVGNHNLKLHVFKSKDPQFIRYKKLWKHVKTYYNDKIDYLLFTDDDDLWALDRTKHFLAHVGWLSFTPESPYGVFPYHFKGDVTIARDAKTWKDVLSHNFPQQRNSDIFDNYVSVVNTQHFSLHCTIMTRIRIIALRTLINSLTLGPTHY